MNKLLILSFLLIAILLSGCTDSIYKINRCVELCAGEHNDIQFVIENCRNFCQMLYESEGIEGLDRQIKSYETTTTVITTTTQ